MIYLLKECEQLDINLSPFIRFVLISKYRLFARNDLYDELCKIQMLYRKYGEIPMYQFLTIALSRDSLKCKEQCLFVYGLTEEYINSDVVALELYYVTYEKKYNPVNFVN